jgi:hypothetical protein
VRSVAQKEEKKAILCKTKNNQHRLNMARLGLASFANGASCWKKQWKGNNAYQDSQ